MTSTQTERRLAAILAADVLGYSRRVLTWAAGAGATAMVWARV